MSFLKKFVPKTAKFFDLLSEKGEQHNLIFDCDERRERLIEEWRRICQQNFERKEVGFSLRGEDREKVEKRLRALGYIV